MADSARSALKARPMATRPSREVHVSPVRQELGKGKPDRLPIWRRKEGLAVGLPGAAKVCRSKMQSIGFPIARYLDLEPFVAPAIDRSSHWIEVKRHLDETAIVLQRDIPLQADRHAARDRLQAEPAGGNTPHHAVRQQLPACAVGGFRKPSREVVDDRR